MAGGGTDFRVVVVQPGLRGLVTSYPDPPPPEAIGLVISYEHVEVAHGLLRIVLPKSAPNAHPHLRFKLFPGTERLTRRAQRRWIIREFDRGTLMLDMPVRFRRGAWNVGILVCLFATIMGVLAWSRVNLSKPGPILPRAIFAFLLLSPFAAVLLIPVARWRLRVARQPDWTNLTIRGQTMSLADAAGRIEPFDLTLLVRVHRSVGGWRLRFQDCREIALPPDPRLDVLFWPLSHRLLHRTCEDRERAARRTLTRLLVLNTGFYTLPVCLCLLLHFTGVMPASPPLLQAWPVFLIGAATLPSLGYRMLRWQQKLEHRMCGRLHRDSASRRVANFRATLEADA